MRFILAILLPWLQFFTIGRPLAGILCLVLQIILVCLALQVTFVNWICVAIWSAYALSQYHTDRKLAEVVKRRTQGW